MSEQNQKKNTSYNMLGAMLYFFAQWLTTVLVVRLSSYEDAGIFSLSISLANIFYFLALFGLRNFQVSDVSGQYEDKQYLSFRLTMIVISSIACVVVVFFLKADAYTKFCCVIYFLYKALESASDVLFGVCQRYLRYKEILISYAIKAFVTLSGFCLVLWYTQELALALIAMAVLYSVVLILYDWRVVGGLTSVGWDPSQNVQLMKTCLPLLLYSLCLPLVNFVVRYAVELRWGTTILGYYSSVTVILVVMSTLLSAVFVVMIPQIATFYRAGNYKQIAKYLVSASVAIVLLALAALGLAQLAGAFVFSLVFGSDIRPYLYLLLPTLVVSAQLAWLSFFNSVLIALRKNRRVLAYNLIGVIVGVVMLRFFLDKAGLMGSLYAMGVAFGIPLILNALYLFWYLRPGRGV